MNSFLPIYIPIEEACEKTGLTISQLNYRIRKNDIAGVTYKGKKYVLESSLKVWVLIEFQRSIIKARKKAAMVKK